MLKTPTQELLANVKDGFDRITPIRTTNGDQNAQITQAQVYRATKDGKTLKRIIDELLPGKVVALIPETASSEYEKSISEQITNYQRAQGNEDDPIGGGMLALPTSGTTGKPKLTLLPLERICHFLRWGQKQFHFSASTTSLSISPWNFDVSLLDTWAVLAARGRVFTVDSGNIHDADYLKNAILEAQPTFMQLVPSTLRAVLNCLKQQEPLPCVQDIVLTGGSVSRQDRKSLVRAFPRATFHNVYGSTEVNDCLIATFSAGQLTANKRAELGQPLPGVKAYIRNGDGLHELGADSLRGELLIATPWMAIGYINDGKLEPLPHAHGHEESLYPTNDEVEYDGRNIVFLGRRNRTVKIRDQRVSLDEVENVVNGIDFIDMAHAWIAEIDGENQLSLAYLVRPGNEVKNKNLSLRMGMSKVLPAYAIPSKIYQFEGRFPLNGNGKPDGHRIQKSILGGQQ